MNQLHDGRTSQNKQSSGLTPEGKRPYKKPSFQHEKVFETMALSCGKLSHTERQCKFNRRNS
jgi:hypothetical protein